MRHAPCAFPLAAGGRGVTMIRKEFRDILQSTFVRLSFLGIIPLLAILKVSPWKIYHFFLRSMFRILNGYAEHIYLNSFTFLLAVLILWTANQYGTHAFRGEHRDRAFEYLLSFPFSKLRILVYKFVPRVLLLLLLTILYEVLAFHYVVPMRQIQGPLFFFIDPVFFPVWVLFFLAAGFFLGLYEQKNWIAVVTFLTFFSTLLISLGLCKAILRAIDPGIVDKSHFTGLSFLIGVMLVLVVLGTAFFTVYRKFDMKSPGLHARRFAFRVLPPLVLLLFSSIYILISQ
jgi:ABC-type transport system involved in multi-copper enzyme maturation permease subunit